MNGDARSGNGLAQCQMCDNGLAEYFPTIDGDDVDLCPSCYSLLEERGRVEDRAEVVADD